MHSLSQSEVNTSVRIDEILRSHWHRTRKSIHLIASASYPFSAVLRALAEPMWIFPVEGLPGHRYLPGVEAMDLAEAYAEEIICKMFCTREEYRATIQPHSGTQANQIVFNAVLEPRDVVLSMSAAAGGHVSHTVLLGRRNRVLHYPLGPDDTLDYAALEQLALSARPKLIIAGGSAIPRQIEFARISEISRRCGALLHADVSHTALFIVAGVHAPVAPYADFVTFNTSKNMRGPNGGVLLYRKEHHRQIARALFPDTQGGANENMMFAKIVALDVLRQIDIKAYATQMIRSARRMAVAFERRGLSVVTGGTDSHIVLVDLRSHGVTGEEVELRCVRHGVLLNRNLVPRDTLGPQITSGVRAGTACVTILGYAETDLDLLGNWIADRAVGIVDDQATELVAYLTQRYNTGLFPNNALPGSI